MIAATGRFGASWRFALTVSLALLPQACTRISPVRATPSPEAACERFFHDLDRLTHEAGVSDGGAAHVAGAPYLRADRFLASFSGAGFSPEAYAGWLERLRMLDQQRRAGEIANLGIDGIGRGPASPFPGLSTREVVRECGQRLVQRDLGRRERRDDLSRQVAVPDAYVGWQRAAGVYPLTRLVLAEGVARLHREQRRSFLRPPEQLPRKGALLRYGPGPSASLTDREVRELLRVSSRNALQIPEPDPSALERLYEAFAPVWDVETATPADRIGSLQYGPGERIEVDGDAPTVYRFHSRTRFRGVPLLQLNYLIWFPERTASGPLDLYAGRLDGLIWRVTLSAEGQALAYDTIHPCGCYYLIFPGLGYRVVQPEDGTEPVVSPYPLPPPKPGQRLAVRLSAGNHFVQAVYPVAEAVSGIAYRWRDAAELSSLPDRGGRHRSAFDPDGIVAGTGRLERFLLWPSGIVSPGAMRQPGTYAIAMLGRRHFDDADLFDRLLRPLEVAR